MNKENAIFTVFLYMVVLIIAFIFAITTSNTILKEANVLIWSVGISVVIFLVISFF